MTEPTPGWAPKKPPPNGDSEPPPKPKRYWWRFTLASVLIVAVSAAATATSVLLYLDSIAHALSHNNVLNNKLHKALAAVHPGEPENILILGSDKRAGEEFEEEEHGRSDTTILLRLDPETNTISVMSIPRDLQVEIPGFGTEKFNAAYSFGGPKLALQVVKELTGLRINHVVNVDFLGFVRAVDAIGCVYTDVDRRYYHSNAGLPASEQYSEINIQPGYQKLCGVKALQYVRYRHTDTDIVRSARQQAFISDARQRVSLQDLVFDQSGLIDIFTKYTTSDINSKETMLEVLKLFIASRNAPIKQVHFPAELGPSYVYASESAIHEAIKEFLTGESFGDESSESSASSSSAKKKHGKKKAGKAQHKKKQAKPKPKVEVAKPGSDGLVPAREAGESEAEMAARKVGGGFPIFYPTRLPSGAHYVETDPYEHVVDPRVYRFKDDGGDRHTAYKMVAVMEEPDGYHYFGVQGIHGWEDPPILNNPSVTETIHGREYEIFVDSGEIKMIAWHRGANTYWIANDLERSLSNEQMVGMARSANLIIPKKKPKKGRKQP
ncbi:MAG TPA: LCP family protein [Solirubrobacterales bacterium]|nr:LCP family protein [Solirubrobacterales bacterium]